MSKSKYDICYDDTSSEEDEKEILKHCSLFEFKKEIEETKQAFKKEVSNNYNIEDDDFNLNLSLSFIVHKLSLMIIKSPIINEYFANSKKQFLSENIVLNKKYLKEIYIKSVREIYTKPINSNILDNLADHLVADERLFLKKLNYKNHYFHLYPLNNPFQINESIIVQITKEELISAIKTICQKEKLKENNFITRKTQVTNYKVVNHTLIYQSNPSTKLDIFLKFKLLELNKAMKLINFVNEIFDTPELRNALDTEQNQFRQQLPAQIKSNLDLKNKEVVMRSTLSKFFTYNINFNNGISNEIIILERLTTTSMKRFYKNIKDKESIIGSEQITFFKKINFSNIYLIEKQLLYKSTGSRASYLNFETHGKAGSYKNIALSIMNIKKNLTICDREIAEMIDLILKGEIDKLTQLMFVKTTVPEKQTELEAFIFSLTYLLFGTEVSRNPACLIIHRMMLDLIIEEKEGWDFLQLFTHEEKNASDKKKNASDKIVRVSGGKMPMSQKRMEKPDIGVVDISRFIHKNFKTTIKYNYDKSLIIDEFSKNNNAYNFLKKFIDLEAEIIKAWLNIKGINIFIFSIELIYPLLSSIKSWYNISLEHIIASQIEDHDYLATLNIDIVKKISKLSLEELILLNKILENSCLVQYLIDLIDYTTFEIIIYAFKHNKLEMLSNKIVFKIMDEEYGKAEEILKMFEFGMTVEMLNNIYNYEGDDDHNIFGDFVNFLDNLDNNLFIEECNYILFEKTYEEVMSEYGNFNDGIFNKVIARLMGKSSPDSSSNSSNDDFDSNCCC